MHPGIQLLLEIGASRPELLLTGKVLTDQGRVATVMLEAGWSSEQLRHIITDQPLPHPVRTTVGAIIAARLRAAQAYPPPATLDSRHRRGDVLEDEPRGRVSAERSATASAARTVTEALTYRALVECADCGVPGTAPGEDLCPACLGWPPCRTCPGPTPRRAHPEGDGRCTTCATASTPPAGRKHPMTTYAPPTAGITQQLSPFAQQPQQPQQWERKRSRAVRSGHVCCGSRCAAGCEPVLIRERTGWGWIDWTVPADGSLPEQPHRVAVFTPIATRSQRLSLRWLARRPAHRIRLGPVTVRPATTVVTALTLAAATLALMHGVPLSIVLPAAALAPLLVEHLPDRLDTRAGEHARIVEVEAACRYLQRLAALHAGLVQAAAGNDLYEVRRAVEIGHHQLFDTADLLQRHDTRSASSELIARERLMLQLAVQTRQIVTPTDGDAAAARHDRFGGQPPLGPYPPGSRWRPQPSGGLLVPLNPEAIK
ncbi:hypothetical protein ACIHCX_16400 [Streptomyces sp. NPDC052043]|uniref:hypothetical protein n=1 Tax=Streptomyces sp. NPDC052043 TaxID=3365684 RepID=UPI0037D110C7